MAPLVWILTWSFYGVGVLHRDKWSSSSLVHGEAMVQNGSVFPIPYARLNDRLLSHPSVAAPRGGVGWGEREGKGGRGGGGSTRPKSMENETRTDHGSDRPGNKKGLLSLMSSRTVVCSTSSTTKCMMYDMLYSQQ